MPDRCVYFGNSGLIDLDFFRLMGVNVKENENPIGHFGTGLKYAIAVLLRTGHKVILMRKGKRYVFTTKPQTIRGKTFDRVCMNDEELAFTTDLGKEWEVWMAYRELHSNTLDEAGVITHKPIEHETLIIVEGAACYREYLNRGQIFCETKPIAANSSIEIHPGPSRAIYYRGVRAGALPGGETLFRYNILADMELTEDRTFASQWEVEWTLARIIPTIEHKGVASELLEGTENWDQNIDFSQCGAPSKEFLEIAAARYSDTAAPAAAKKLVERDMQARANYKPALLMDHEAEKLGSAFHYLKKLSCTLQAEDVEVVETLGPNTFGIYHKAKDQIFLAKMTLDWGMETVVATLYEEWLHKEYHYRDKTTSLQNFLFQRLAAIAMGKDGPEPEDQRKERMPF